ncbi:MAG: hypothetical protein D6719_02815 [Candidatus Dadabacteria bacterium]|nr:MAG: hypothetical protein D6719_02815 [Candidatus Dadabacteria bacterium]
MKIYRDDNGSIELIVLGLLAALIVVLAIPLLSGVNTNAPESSTPTVQTQVQHNAHVANHE